MEQVNAKRVLMFVVAACLVGMVVGSAVTMAVLNEKRAIPTSGSVVAVNVAVYSDSACTLNLTSINWGFVYPGDSVSRTIYVKNGGNIPLTLSMAAAGWNPAAAAGQIAIILDRENFALGPGHSTSASLTLGVSPSVSGITDFSVNVVITGVG